MEGDKPSICGGHRAALMSLEDFFQIFRGIYLPLEDLVAKWIQVM
jgi:hypothetical protein